MTYVCGLALLTLFLPGTARRSLRIEDSRHDAQQSITSTNAFEGLAEAREIFAPLPIFRARNTGGSFHTNNGRRNRQWLPKSNRLVRPFMQVDWMESSWGRSPGPPQFQASEALYPVLVEADALRTWSFESPAVEQVQVVLSSDGRPVDAKLEVWTGPDNTPMAMNVYVENGRLCPFSALIGTPRGSNSVTVRNIGQMQFPISARVGPNNVDTPSLEAQAASTPVQGGAVRSFPVDPRADSVEVLLRSGGNPLNARIELLQGPNSISQVVEFYTEDGFDRPCFFILRTVGSGNVVRIVNTSPVEFPMHASVVPHSMNARTYSDGVFFGGDSGW